MKASKRQRKGYTVHDAVHDRLETLADARRDEIARILAEQAASGPPGVVLIFPANEPALFQPSTRETVLALASALGADPVTLGPLSPVLVVGAGRAVLLGSAVGAVLPFSPGGVA